MTGILLGIGLFFHSASAEDTCCKDCEKDLFGKTSIDYVKLYEGMGIEANIFEEFHVAYDYGEYPLM